MEKEKQNKKKNPLVLIALLVFVIVWRAFTGQEIPLPAGLDLGNLWGNSYSDELEVYYLDVGQGDCTIIRFQDQAMIIDAGNNDQEENVVSYLNYLKIRNLTYIIGTHPDADHVGGLDAVIKNFTVENIFMPHENRKTKTYQDVLTAMKKKKYTSTLPKVGSQYSLGSAIFTVIHPGKEYEASNNNSLSILLEYGENRFLFSGDAEFEAEADMLNSGLSLKADVYKAGHHGSKTSTSKKFFSAINPTYVVISCAKDNPYGHPHAKTLNTLRGAKIQLYRTDEQGTIVAFSNGKTIRFNTSAGNNFTPGEPKNSAP
ncbi:competence protein ComE [Clostridia bacterium]|nr:competence protein ComE [Clostridia bacterium]